MEIYTLFRWKSLSDKKLKTNLILEYNDAKITKDQFKIKEKFCKSSIVKGGMWA